MFFSTRIIIGQNHKLNSETNKMAGGQSAGEFFGSIPPITKYITGFSFAMTLATALKLVHPMSLILSFDHIFGSQLQVWKKLKKN